MNWAPAFAGATNAAFARTTITVAPAQAGAQLDAKRDQAPVVPAKAGTQRR